MRCSGRVRHRGFSRKAEWQRDHIGIRSSRTSRRGAARNAKQAGSPPAEQVILARRARLRFVRQLEIAHRAGEMSSMPENIRKPAARQPIKAGDHLILVDGSGFVFRAFFAVQTAQRMSRRDDLPTGAVLVFCNMIWKLLQEGPTPQPGDEPTHFAVVFDYSAKTFRNEIYTEYKAHRPEPPSDLVPQFGLIRQASRA